MKYADCFSLPAVTAVVLLSWAAVSLGASPEVAQELDARRLIGEAHYENGDFKLAAEEFRRCIELAPDSAVDRFNLALVQTRATQYDDALRLLEEARQCDPDLIGASYLRGIVYKRQGNYQAAIENLQRVASGDAHCWGTRYNLGVCYKNLRDYENATSAFEAAVRIDPNHPSAHYQLITLARLVGDVEKAKRQAEIFDRVKDTIDQSQKTPEALERSKYSNIMQSPRMTGDPAAAAIDQIRFSDVTAAAGLQSSTPPPAPADALPNPLDSASYSETEARNRYVSRVGGAVALGDCDGDGDLDVYVACCASDEKASGNRLYRNQGNGRFTDVTAAAGVGDARMGMDAVFGDFDNDGHTDLYVVNCGPNVLYRNHGDGTFEDVSEQARTDEPQFGRQAVFVDYDHDNDLDLLIANDAELAEPPESAKFSIPDDFPGQVNTLLRNNGNGTFLDQTDEAGLLVDFSQSRAVVFADFDGDYDTDLFICNADAPSLFFANARLGKFLEGGTFAPKIEQDARAVAEGDFDRDGDPDLLVAFGKALYRYTNDGKAAFQGAEMSLPQSLGIAGVGRIGIFDYNNDGWSDVLLVDAEGRSLGLLEGAGADQFRDVSTATGLSRFFGQIADVAIGDLDGDGNQDILLQTRDRGLRLLRNGGTSRHWINVQLAGEKVNRSGYGATVEIAVGGHYQRQTVHDGPIHFGLGDLAAIDVIRVTWPNGVAQNVIRPPLDRGMTIKEKVRVSASCAMLFAYNGTRFELINEILGVGPLGVPMAPGVYHQPDCTELTKIEAGQLVSKDGVYELRLIEELREITFADQLTLRVVDHPAGLEVIPNEMFKAPPFPEDKFFAVKEHRAPRSAVDDRGTDVLPMVLKRDGRFPKFPMTPYDGLARRHSITLDLGDLASAKQIMLYLDGWIYWSESSTVMAVAQDPRFEFLPLSLEVRDRQGRWRAVIESVGLPTSKGIVVPVDLSGRFLCDDYHVRLSTNLCVYFDRIFVSTSDEARRCRVMELPVARADLSYRGFSRMSRDEFGFERFDFGDVSPIGPWNPPEGRFTRYGEVTELLWDADDRFVIFGPGDELALRFDGGRLPKLPAGWVRDFIFYANGWVKDGDLNTTLSGRVGPLPFHGMSGYPLGEGERCPRTADLDRYRRTYNTRQAAVTVGKLDAR